MRYCRMRTMTCSNCFFRVTASGSWNIKHTLQYIDIYLNTSHLSKWTHNSNTFMCNNTIQNTLKSHLMTVAGWWICLIIRIDLVQLKLSINANKNIIYPLLCFVCVPDNSIFHHSDWCKKRKWKTLSSLPGWFQQYLHSDPWWVEWNA